MILWTWFQKTFTIIPTSYYQSYISNTLVSLILKITFYDFKSKDPRFPEGNFLRSSRTSGMYVYMYVYVPVIFTRAFLYIISFQANPGSILLFRPFASDWNGSLKYYKKELARFPKILLTALLRSSISLNLKSNWIYIYSETILSRLYMAM